MAVGMEITEAMVVMITVDTVDMETMVITVVSSFGLWCVVAYSSVFFRYVGNQWCDVGLVCYELYVSTGKIMVCVCLSRVSIQFSFGMQIC